MAENTNPEEKMQKERRQSTKPSLEIYRPPGLRNKSAIKRNSFEAGGIHDFDQASVASSSDSRSSAQELVSDGKEKPKTHLSKGEVRHNLFQETSNPVLLQSDDISKTTTESPKSCDGIKENVSTISKILDQIDFALFEEKVRSSVLEITSGESLDEEAIEWLGQFLIKYAIEDNRKNAKSVAKLCSNLLKFHSTGSIHFQSALLKSVQRYFEGKEQLRAEVGSNSSQHSALPSAHFNIWLGFLHFISELVCLSMLDTPCDGGQIVHIFVQTVEYLLAPPILMTIKIEELEELLLGPLLSAGRDLERHHPSQLGRLKDMFRDAFIASVEPWVRRMLLLLVELAASDWLLARSSNEFYFQFSC